MDILRFMTAGHVDDGKSTLIGRLFQDQGLIPRDIFDGMQGLAQFTDGLREEREKGITLDVAYRYFQTRNRKFIVADAPGHTELTRNMVTAATQVDAAVLLVDADRFLREQKLSAQTERHLRLCRWLGVQAIVVVNKLDLLGFEQAAYEKVAEAFGPKVQLIPVSALQGDNIVTLSSKMPWYAGPTLKDWLLSVPVSKTASAAEVVIPVQWTSKTGAVCGPLLAGDVREGASLFVAQTGERVSIQKLTATGGGALRMRLSSELQRGQVLVKRAVPTSLVWKAEWFWLAATPLNAQKSYLVRQLTTLAKGQFSLEKTENEIASGALSLDQAFIGGVSDRVAVFDPDSGDTVAVVLLRESVAR